MTEEQRKALDQAMDAEYAKLRGMNPQEKGRYLGEAMKFCLEKNLIRHQELKQMKDPAFSRAMAPKALLRRTAYLLAHP